MFKTRLKTGAVLFVVVCTALLFSYIPWVLNLAVIFLCFFSVWEMAIALAIPHKLAPVLVGLIELIILMLLPKSAYHVILLALFIILVIFFCVLMSWIAKVKHLKQSEKFMLLTTIPVLFSAMKYIREEPDGLYQLTTAILVCMITDSFAYLVGRKMGRKKLAPTISPNKSVEGCIGGTLAASAFLLMLGLIYAVTAEVEISYFRLGIYLITASLIGQFGDLCMSAVKRVAKIKDYGELLPGHGGILDRFDSQLFVLPYTYLFCVFCGKIF